MLLLELVSRVRPRPKNVGWGGLAFAFGVTFAFYLLTVFLKRRSAAKSRQSQSQPQIWPPPDAEQQSDRP
jgi:hypothetical protein